MVVLIDRNVRLFFSSGGVGVNPPFSTPIHSPIPYLCIIANERRGFHSNDFQIQYNYKVSEMCVTFIFYISQHLCEIQTMP